MTDAEFDLLVMLAQSPREEREVWLAQRRSPLASELRSSTAQGVLNLLRGEPARGSAAKAWLALVEQEAKRLTQQRSVAS